jgi:hypothetical protein
LASALSRIAQGFALRDGAYPEAAFCASSFEFGG